MAMVPCSEDYGIHKCFAKVHLMKEQQPLHPEFRNGSDREHRIRAQKGSVMHKSIAYLYMVLGHLHGSKTNQSAVLT